MSSTPFMSGAVGNLNNINHIVENVLNNNNADTLEQSSDTKIKMEDKKNNNSSNIGDTTFSTNHSVFVGHQKTESKPNENIAGGDVRKSGAAMMNNDLEAVMSKLKKSCKVDQKTDFVYKNFEGQPVFPALNSIPSDEFDIDMSDDDEEIDEGVNLLLDPGSLLDNETPCVLCDFSVTDIDSTKKKLDSYLAHLIVKHCLVISDCNQITDKQNYFLHWKNRLKNHKLSDFCHKILTNCGPKDFGPKEEYYLLSDSLPEDKEVRQKLKYVKLKQLLLRLEFERKDCNFERNCLFCNKVFRGNRKDLFSHMSEAHNFRPGHPDNMVNVREFLDLIESKMNNLQCLMCENIFKDRVALREHMRKKNHRKLNPQNKEYDKFYLINYTELNMNWIKIHQEADDVDEDDFEGWPEKEGPGFCFFCSQAFNSVSAIFDHMKEKHSFDFLALCKSKSLSFYEKAKMINYIRSEVNRLRNCNTQESTASVEAYVIDAIQEGVIWNQPQYYFPTLKDDLVLRHIYLQSNVWDYEDSFILSEDNNYHKVLENSIISDLISTGELNESNEENTLKLNANNFLPKKITHSMFPYQ